MSALFVAGNEDTQLASYRPVIAYLERQWGFRCTVLLLDNFYGTVSSGALELQAGEVVRFPFRSSLSKGNMSSQVLMVYAFHRHLRTLLRQLRPKVIVTGNDITHVDQAVISQGERQGIPSVVIEDGVRLVETVIPPLRYRLRRSIINMIGRKNLVFNSHLGLGGGPTYLAVWGPYSDRYYKARGVSEKRLVITGQPRFDEIFARNWTTDGEKAYDTLGLSPGQKRVLFLPNWISPLLDGYSQVSGMRSLLEALITVSEGQGEQCRLIVKLPRVDDNISRYYNALPQQLMKGVVTVQHVPLYPLLAGCDAAITFYSTAGLEALMFRKPLVTLNFARQQEYFPYASSGAALCASSTAELVSSLQRVLFDSAATLKLRQKADAFVADQIHGTDGKSADRVAHLIFRATVGS